MALPAGNRQDKNNDEKFDILELDLETEGSMDNLNIS